MKGVAQVLGDCHDAICVVHPGCSASRKDFDMNVPLMELIESWRDILTAEPKLAEPGQDGWHFTRECVIRVEFDEETNLYVNEDHEEFVFFIAYATERDALIAFAKDQAKQLEETLDALEKT